MRIVIFTALPDITDTPWWQVLQRSPAIGPILVVRRVQEPGLGPLLRRLRANVRKHGLIFIPVRIVLLAVAATHRLLPRGRRAPARGRDAVGRDRVPALAIEDVIEETDIHGPRVLSRVREWAPDLGLSIGAPILRPALFGIPALGTINVHLGRVPEFRGAPPGFWELHEGATEIGATVHWMNEGLDTGPVITEALAPIYAADLLADVEARAEELGARVLHDALARVAEGRVIAIEQRAGGATRRMPTLMTRARLWSRLSARRLRLSALRPRWWSKLGATALALGVVRPVRDLWRTVVARQPVRVFNYHRVTELCRDGMTISPRAFRMQVEYILRTHDVVPLARALDLMESGARLRRPVAVLTFDDAYLSVWEHAAPILHELGVVATVYVSSSLAGTDRRFEHDADNPVRPHLSCMTWEQLQALCAAGWSVGSHTANHVRLSACTGAELERELREPLDAFAAHALPTERTLAFPFGQPSDISGEALTLAEATNHRMVFADHGGDNATGARTSRLRHRIDVGGNHPTLSWKAKVRGVPLDSVHQWRGA